MEGEGGGGRLGGGGGWWREIRWRGRAVEGDCREKVVERDVGGGRGW